MKLIASIFLLVVGLGVAPGPGTPFQTTPSTEQTAGTDVVTATGTTPVRVVVKPGHSSATVTWVSGNGTHSAPADPGVPLKLVPPPDALSDITITDGNIWDQKTSEGRVFFGNPE